MMLSRAKPAVGAAAPRGDKRKKKGKKVPQRDELLAQRDFTGAIALLEFKRQAGEQEEEEADLWVGYCAFHLGDYKRALEEYEALTKQPGCNPDVWVNLACTYFFLGMYTQAEQSALKGPESTCASGPRAQPKTPGHPGPTPPPSLQRPSPATGGGGSGPWCTSGRADTSAGPQWWAPGILTGIPAGNSGLSHTSRCWTCRAMRQKPL